MMYKRKISKFEASGGSERNILCSKAELCACLCRDRLLIVLVDVVHRWRSPDLGQCPNGRLALVRFTLVVLCLTVIYYYRLSLGL